MNNLEITAKKVERRGGAGRGQGAKLKYNEPTKTVRLPISLVEKLNSGLIDIAMLSKIIDQQLEVIK